ncbi:MAG: helix-turn-helix transcriptional regulator [Hyphomicrobiaceae bacterium]
MPPGSQTTTTPTSPSDEFNASIGQTARRLREASFATLQEVAEALDTPVGDYQRFEEGLGRLSPTQLVSLARLHGVSVEQLIGSVQPVMTPSQSLEADSRRLLSLFEQLDATKRRECLAFAERLASP